MLRFKVLNATDPPYPLRTRKVMTHASARRRTSATFAGAPLPTLRVCVLGLAIFASGFVAGPSTYAQSVGDQSVRVPGFWDPRRRPEKPDLSRVTVIRFLTEIDYPPFNFAGPDGNPQGFNVELARKMCDEL